MLALVVTNLAACGGSLEPVPVALKCAPLPGDITAEVKRGPVVKGETGFEVAGRLISQVKQKNASLDRAIKNYDACRAS